MSVRAIESLTSRIATLIVVIVMVFLALVGRLYYLQVYKSSHYLTLSDKNRIQTTPLKSERGRILDRNGTVIAHNQPRYHAIFDRRKNKNFSKALATIQTILNLTEEEVADIEKQVETVPKYIPLELKRNLSWQELSALEINSFDIPGLEILQSEERVYPHGESLSHVLGYVAKPNQDDLNKNILLSVPGVVVGKSGLEKYYNEDLSGEFGTLMTENNARGQKIRTLSKEQAIAGQDVTLTIDLPLQNHIYELLKPHKSAAAIVMDIKTGEILALVSIPGYDPNLFTKGISFRQWQSLLKAENNPLTNKVISGLYSPGSLIKTFIAYALLSEPKVGPNFTLGCDGKYPVGSHTFHCWKKIGHGQTNLLKALMQSCDIFFYKTTQLLGIDKLIATLSQFKMGQKTGIDLEHEKAGLLPSPKWKKQRYNQRWWPGDTINLSIGQGALLTTPLQWIYGIAKIANGGQEIQPHLRKGSGESFDPPTKKDPHLTYIQKALDQTVNSPGGTGRRAKLDIPDFRVAGKTSTSQVRRITMKERQQGIRSVAETPWHLRDNAIFTGYAPAQNPRYALTLIVEHGGWGGRTTGPLVKNIFKYIYKHLHKKKSNVS